MVKVGTVGQNTWTSLTGWEVASVQALGDYVGVILKNSAMQNAHMFIHQFSEHLTPCMLKTLALSQTLLN